MAEPKKTNKERLQEITDSIETGIKELFESDKYKQYLSTMSRFHRYSVNNTMLIYMQKPHATHVAGFNKWRDQFGRNVMRGEKGIKIIAPTPYKKKVEEVKLDPDTKAPMFDKDGKPVMEEKEIQIPMFKVVSVFDVSQTEGKPLPQLASDLSGNVKQYEIFMEALRRSSPVPIEMKPISPDTDGFFSIDKQSISIREGMSEVQTVSAVVHEIAHSKLHNSKKIEEPQDASKYQEIEIFDIPGLFSNGRIAPEDVPNGLYRYDLRGSDDDPGMPVAVESHVVVNHAGSILTAKPLDIPEGGCLRLTEDEGMNFVGGDITAYQFLNEHRKDRNTEEVEAESISFAVCAYYGIATGENSFGYIANWSKGKELKELRSSLETINKTSSELITDIDRHFAEICKERGIDLTAQPETAAPEQLSAVQPETAPIPESGAADSLPESPEQTLDEYPMPDESLKAADLEACGYMDGDMLPLSKDQAMELFDKELTVYAIVGGGSAEMLFDRNDFDIQAPNTMFAVSREEWEANPLFHERVMDRQNHQQEREQAFLSHTGDCFAIYQVKHDESQQDIRYEGLDWLKSIGRKVEHENYDLVYTASLPAAGSTDAALDTLWYQFNNEHPADYQHPSMSVSDIVAIKQNGVVSCHYCDSFGFKEVPGFLPQNNPLKNAEMQMEDDYGMIDGIINNGPKESTVAQLEQQARSGQPISLMDLSNAIHREQGEKKKSVVEQLKNQPKQENRKAAQKRSAEREI